jgi:hypothetical protein
MLGKVRWIVVTRGGQLRMGVHYIPGMAQAVSIKSKNINPALPDKNVAALYLPEVPSLKTPPSLIVPRDFFHPDHLAEITHHDETVQTVKMGFSVDKGIDFERISFTPA